MSGTSQALPSAPTTSGSAHASSAPARVPLVFMFPGQSSATPDLLVRARLAHAASAHVVDVAYRVLGDTVQIVRVLHGAQQWPDAL